MSDAKFEVKLALGSKNDMTYLANFNMGDGKSENLYFDVLLLLIADKVSKVQKSISHDTKEWSKLWRKIHVLFENWYE